jgi:NTE family protein
MHKKHFFYNHINYYNLQNLTFEQFYFLTGVNFTVTGANITNKVSLYFSKDRTPDFPVVDAVLISMNLPGIFPPIWNKADVFQDDKQFSSVCNYNYKAYNSMYKGKYVDGGIMNNLPIHAFDDVKNVFEFYVDPRKPIKNEIFNKKVLGLRLTENKNHEDGVVNPEEDFALASSVEELLFSALQYSEEGKILSKEEREACVDLLTYELATTNFTPNQKQVQMPLVDAFGSVFTYLNGYVYRTPRRLRDMILKWDKV